MQKFSDPVFDRSPLSWAEWVFVGVAATGSLWLLGLAIVMHAAAQATV